MNASELIDNQIAELGDWRGTVYAQLRQIVRDADPEMREEWKWGTGMWSRSGNVCAVGAFKDHIALNFFKGASLPDPQALFNGGLDAKASRSIQFREGDSIDEPALKELIGAAVAYNTKSSH